eukprot:4769224-Alexandrium_andersonii.AAC.1
MCIRDRSFAPFERGQALGQDITACSRRLKAVPPAPTSRKCRCVGMDFRWAKDFRWRKDFRSAGGFH